MGRLRHRRPPTLLGEAFALKESPARQELADAMRLHAEIRRQRRSIMLRLVAGIGGLMLLVAVGLWMFSGSTLH